MSIFNSKNSLTPDLSKIRHFDKIKFENFYLPIFDVGGDYYYVSQLNENEIFFTIADVSGKGFSAANLKPELQKNVENILASSYSLPYFITMLNRLVINNFNGEKFITMFTAIFNNKTNQLQYVNAGHNPPILYDKRNQQIKYLDKGCVGIGMIEDIKQIKEDSIYINYNSKLLCYTDGLIEVIVENSVEHHEKEVEKYFCTKEPVRRSMDLIVEEMNIQKSNRQIFDDVAILGVDFNVENQ